MNKDSQLIFEAYKKHRTYENDVLNLIKQNEGITHEKLCKLAKPVYGGNCPGMDDILYDLAQKGLIKSNWEEEGVGEFSDNNKLIFSAEYLK
jgi:hypothetical protein